MPTNSFENFHLSWTPDKSKVKRPFYLTLANALEADIISGKLASGTKLPPQRELADYLEVDRSGLSNEISKLRREGVLDSEKNRFTVYKGVRQ